MSYAGLSIGLFGGSFNPAHMGHMHVARTGLNILGLDRMWWMVSPQNPLKPQQPSYESRVKTVETLGLPPRMEISHMERDFGTQYTADTLAHAQKRWPDTRFVFLMGADNFAQLPRWKHWQDIIECVPIAVIARPGGRSGHHIRARTGRAATQYKHARIPESDAHILQYYTAPAWTFLTLPHDPLSSTRLRALQG